MTHKRGTYGMATRQAGVTLVELLVAMAIFIVLMGGLAALFSNAVQTVVFGYQQQEGFEKARASLKVLERDLQHAFTARDYGDKYNFYGAENGFAFVGVLDDGALGRVTYVLHPTADSKTFTTPFAALYGDLHNVVYGQGYRAGVTSGGDDATGTALAFSYVQTLLGYLLSVGAIDNAVAATVETITQEYVNLPVSGPANPSRSSTEPGAYLRLHSAAGNAAYDVLVELENINIETGAILRYEEELTDLETFTVRNSAGDALVWPQMSLTNPLEDVPGSSPALLTGMQMAVNPSAGIIDPPDENFDLRNLYLDNLGFLSRLGPAVFEDMFRARKRDLWIEMLRANPNYPAFWRSGDATDPRPEAAAYVLVEDIITSAYIPGIETPLPVGGRLNVIDIPPPFAYKPQQAGYRGEWLRAFNGLNNLPGYNQYLAALGSGTGDVDQIMRAFDATLTESAGPSETELGTPVEPKLPSYVRVQFWIALRPKFTSNREFRRWFVEEFVVPSAISRDTVATLTQRERS